MKTIRAGFSYHPGGMFSILIRGATRSAISHVYLRLPVPEYRTDVIFQAAGLNVGYCAKELFESKNIVVEEYDIEVSDDQWEKAEAFRVTEVGKPYSRWQIIGFAWVLAMRQIGKKVKNPFSNGDHAYVCVEVVAKCAGLKDAESLTPEDLRRWCARNSKRVR